MAFSPPLAARPPTRRVRRVRLDVPLSDVPLSTCDVLACNEPMLVSSQAEAYVPARSYPGQPQVLPLADGPDYSPHGRSRSFRGATMSGIEWDEWKMVEALVRPSHTVLEFGARCAAH